MMESKGFVREHFEFLVIIAAIVGAFMINRSDLSAIQAEIKDFHGRLCTLEERYQQILQRSMEDKR
jgi:hypothetical protein